MRHQAPVVMHRVVAHQSLGARTTACTEAATARRAINTNTSMASRVAT
jgi:hypothetical protein